MVIKHFGVRIKNKRINVIVWYFVAGLIRSWAYQWLQLFV